MGQGPTAPSHGLAQAGTDLGERKGSGLGVSVWGGAQGRRVGGEGHGAQGQAGAWMGRARAMEVDVNKDTGRR